MLLLNTGKFHHCEDVCVISNYHTGGPGNSGVEAALEYAALLAQGSGGNFDIVGFDPRGIGFSQPLGTCPKPWKLVDNFTLASTNSYPYIQEGQDSSNKGSSSHGMPGAPIQDLLNYGHSYASDVANSCAPVIGGKSGAGRYMSTVYIALDMIQFIDAEQKRLGGKKMALLNYIGYSYGTFIGEVFANMFPTRVGSSRW